MDVTREQHISHIFELREMLLLFQIGFILVSAAVIYAILESISSLEPLSVITEPRYLKPACDCFKFLSTCFDLCVDSTGDVCHAAEALLRHSTDFFQFFFLTCEAINVISKAEIGDCSASKADSTFLIF